jgi:hypothetical protein
MNGFVRLSVAAAALCWMVPAFAQKPAAPASAAPGGAASSVPLGMAMPELPAAAPAAPTAEALALASKLVDLTGGSGMGAMNGLPMGGLAKLLGATDPEQSRIVMHDAVMPTLNDHADDLTKIQVEAYASSLTVDELKGAVAFYSSPAGKAMQRTKFAVLRSKMQGVQALIVKLRPELEAKTKEVLKAHEPVKADSKK